MKVSLGLEAISCGYNRNLHFRKGETAAPFLHIRDGGHRVSIQMPPPVEPFAVKVA